MTEINIQVNGETHRVQPDSSISTLLKALEIQGRYAVELNQEIIAKALHAETALHENDRIEIVQAIGGG